MDNKKNDGYYIDKIKNDLVFINNHVSGKYRILNKCGFRQKTTGIGGFPNYCMIKLTRRKINLERGKK